MSFKFVKPDTHRINLADGEWIEVKKTLNTGDQKRLESVGTKPPINVDGRVFQPIDWEVYEIERAMVVMLDWSAKDDEGEKIKLSADALRALEPESFQEINIAVMKHVVERAKEKNELREAKLREAAKLTQPSKSSPPVRETESSPTLQ